MTGSVLSNLLAMYLWTFPPDKRHDVIMEMATLAYALLSERTLPQSPPDVRAPS